MEAEVELRVTGVPCSLEPGSNPVVVNLAVSVQ